MICPAEVPQIRGANAERNGPAVRRPQYTVVLAPATIYAVPNERTRRLGYYARVVRNGRARIACTLCTGAVPVVDLQNAEYTTGVRRY